MPNTSPIWDIFISHASEDKDGFVRPLAHALQGVGVKVWYDELSLKLGDSLSRSIDKGLAQSRYGVVILSAAFMRKAWPEYELRGLVAREIGGHSVILPIWFGVDHEDVLAFSPPLADKVAVKTGDVGSAEEIALQILSVVRPDIYAKIDRTTFKHQLGEADLAALQEELDAARQELAEYRCPSCGSDIVEQQDVPLDLEQKHSGLLRSFECGFVELDGGTQRPCPNDPRFPKFEEYDVQCHEDTSEKLTMFRWTCHAFPKTIMARAVRLDSFPGPTEGEARARLQEQYHRLARKR
ncbi:hypothetical protein ACVW1C_002325 [Bradyrhizobium sp. USDA 4011]